MSAELGVAAVPSPEAVLTWASVRNLETHTDIGPGGVSRLLIEVNFRQHGHALALLDEAGYVLVRRAAPEQEDAHGR